VLARSPIGLRSSLGAPAGLKAPEANPARMRNRALHDALRDFALESAAFLTDIVRDGAELEFDVIDGGHGSGPSL